MRKPLALVSGFFLPQENLMDSPFVNTTNNMIKHALGKYSTHLNQQLEPKIKAVGTHFTRSCRKTVIKAADNIVAMIPVPEPTE
jgi:hypothetical protein